MLKIMDDNRQSVQKSPWDFLGIMESCKSKTSYMRLRLLSPAFGDAGLIEEWTTQLVELQTMVVKVNTEPSQERQGPKAGSKK
jgi:hypothetical protein